MYSCHAIRKENSNYTKPVLLVAFSPNKMGRRFATRFLRDALRSYHTRIKMLLEGTNSPQDCRTPAQKGDLFSTTTLMSFRLSTSASIVGFLLSCFQGSFATTEIPSNVVWTFCHHITRVHFDCLTLRLKDLNSQHSETRKSSCVNARGIPSAT